MSVSAVVRRWTLAIPLAASVALSAPLRDAAAQPPAALVGRVTSAAEGPMEGVLVSAKRDGSTKTVTVVSRADGAYAFPRDRLEPGRYALSVRAVKYVLADRGAAAASRLRPEATAHADLELRESNPLELALQLTDPEWLASYPLDDKTKWELFRDCSRCHTMRRPSMSTYNAEELAWVLMRMVYSAGSSPMRFQLPASATPHWGRAEGGEPSGLQRRQAEAVAAINLHKGDVDLRAQDVAAAERQGDRGHLHHLGLAGDEPAARHAHRGRRHRSGSTISTTTRSAGSIRKPARRRNGGGRIVRKKARSRRPARAR